MSIRLALKPPTFSMMNEGVGAGKHNLMRARYDGVLTLRIPTRHHGHDTRGDGQEEEEEGPLVNKDDDGHCQCMAVQRSGNITFVSRPSGR